MINNRLIYESPSFSNILMKSTNNEVHQNKIRQIRNRENKFLKMSASNKDYTQSKELKDSHSVSGSVSICGNKTISVIKNGVSPKQNVRRSSAFDQDYLYKLNKDNEILYMKIRNMYEKNQNKYKKIENFDKSYNQAKLLKIEHSKNHNCRRKLQQEILREENSSIYKRLSKVLPVLNMKKITDDVNKISIPPKKDLSEVYFDSIKKNREKSIHEKLRKISADRFKSKYFSK